MAPIMCSEAMVLAPITPQRKPLLMPLPYPETWRHSSRARSNGHRRRTTGSQDPRGGSGRAGPRRIACPFPAYRHSRSSGRRVVLGVGNVVEPDHRNIAADHNSAQTKRTRCAHRDDVVVTGERGWRLRTVESPFDRDTPAVPRGWDFKDQGFVRGEAPAVERGAPAGDALALRRHVFVTPDKGDTTMAQLQKVLDSGTLALLIVGTDIGE